MGSGSMKKAVAFAAVLGLCSAGAFAQGVTRNVTVVNPSSLSEVNADNAAGVAIDILPSDQFAIGAKVVFRVTTKKPGYLILVDVDASGKVTQRYPNLYSMALPAGASENANLVQPGKPVAIPDLSNPFAHFEYIAEAPAGQGLILALLSPKPVHVVDLPDVPQEMIGTNAAANFLYDAARRLRIAGRDAGAPLADPQWSFAVKSYSITP
ncbi:conserved exported hypothetical protein [Methylocella tundrae]|uniref:DUF4384 domain-containing protein n=1 Tax=Methylocella tundrae TaxID=227605 RepID=A0A8B6M1A0_METTU|nr:DUF4384 domain-containing protein [Methylocella tundrae]VTZ48153.1 conserved exported hypothetical protein [Methylocella tundrae]